MSHDGHNVMDNAKGALLSRGVNCLPSAPVDQQPVTNCLEHSHFHLVLMVLVPPLWCLLLIQLNNRIWGSTEIQEDCCYVQEKCTHVSWILKRLWRHRSPPIVMGCFIIISTIPPHVLPLLNGSGYAIRHSNIYTKV